LFNILRLTNLTDLKEANSENVIPKEETNREILIKKIASIIQNRTAIKESPYMKGSELIGTEIAANEIFSIISKETASFTTWVVMEVASGEYATNEGVQDCVDRYFNSNKTGCIGSLETW
jgi:hypothetical protein